MHAVRREQRLPRGVRPGDRSGVGVDEGLPAGRGADGQRDDGDVAVGGVGEGGAQGRHVAQGLEHQPDDPGLGERERVGEVVGGRGDQLLAGRDGEGVLQPAVGAQHRGEHRAGVGHQRDRAGRHRVPLEVADRAHAARPR